MNTPPIPRPDRAAMSILSPEVEARLRDELANAGQPCDKEFIDGEFIRYGEKRGDKGCT